METAAKEILAVFVALMLFLSFIIYKYEHLPSAYEYLPAKPAVVPIINNPVPDVPLNEQKG